ncbi:CTP synthase [uncultured Deinococcus sp.]|uniref:CTP synthase n=1 Tax=uncultured Deinococcus sp. TaxID=158789 RepID=UPI00258F41AA|nr:CTP synthase [uncultured Deinococcus sp.]
MKYIFVTGGVVSSLGKGVASASLGALLRARGYRVTAVKIDPYINIDAGTMRPYEHGEVFVTASGAETDLDIGNYERFLDLDVPPGSNITTGQVYQEVIRKERAGDYLSQTVQVIPHVTDEIKRRVRVAGESAGAEVVLIEVGGTVGDIESLPFLEAIRQFRFDEGDENVLYLHLTLVPYLGTSNEFKTKPTQHSVAALRSYGISPDIVMVRSKEKLPPEITRKIAAFTSVRENRVFSSYDVAHVYEVPLALEEQGLGKAVEDLLGLERIHPNLGVWQNAVKTIKRPEREVTIAIAGKYTAMPDAYLSMLESLTHAGVANDARVNVKWVNAEELTEGDLEAQFGDVGGILVPGGFGVRGIEGKIRAAEYARTRGVPYLGICLGMQIAVIEYARHVAGLEGANSTEFDEYARHKVVGLMPEQLDVEGLGGTMRLGDWPMQLAAGTTIAELYGVPAGGTVRERHRHRFEVNPEYVPRLQDAGLTVSGVTPGMNGRGAGLVESVEIPGHPFFVALQAHPEFKSRPMRPSPPFAGFVAASLKRQEQGQEPAKA